MKQRRLQLLLSLKILDTHLFNCTHDRLDAILLIQCIAVRRPEFRGVPTIFLGPFLNLVPLLTSYVGTYIIIISTNSYMIFEYCLGSSIYFYKIIEIFIYHLYSVLVKSITSSCNNHNKLFHAVSNYFTSSYFFFIGKHDLFSPHI